MLDAESYIAEIEEIDALARKWIARSAGAVRKLQEMPSTDAVELACLCCRNAVQLVFFSRGRIGSGARQKMTQLQDSIDIAIAVATCLRQQPHSDPVISGYIDNMYWRRELLSATLRHDKKKIREILNVAC